MTRPITVLDLRDSPWVDGPGRTILDCAETIDPSRYRIGVGAFDGGAPEGSVYEHEARRRGLDVVRIHEQRSLDPGVLHQIVEQARQLGADILHTHGFRTDLFGLAAARRLRMPLVSTVHGWIANDFKGKVSTRLDKLILRWADHVIAVSDRTRRQLGGWATDKRCTVIPNALRTERYRPSRGAGAFRMAAGISSDEIVIANIGRLSPEKGQMPFLEAARDLLRRHRGLRFVLFGIGPDQDVLERFVAENGMTGAVLFAGYRADMDALYNELDLVVQSSFTEGMPNVILEALLMEVPVIATDVGGTDEVISGGKTGLLISSGDHEALVSAMERFLADRPRFQTMARQGREDVVLRFDHGRRVERLVAVYDRVLHEYRNTV